MEDVFALKDYHVHPFTDAMVLRMDTSLLCLNLPAGYYNYHYNNEYCIAEEMDNAVLMGIYLINMLGNKEYLYEYNSDDINNEDDEFFYEKFESER